MMGFDTIRVIVLLITPLGLYFWTKCTLNYLQITRYFRNPGSWRWTLIAMLGIFGAYFTWLAYLLTGENFLWMGFVVFGVMGTLPFLLGNLESYLSLRKVAR